MSELTKIVYWGSLDEYYHDEFQITLKRGVPGVVPVEAAKRLTYARRGQPREFFYENEAIPEKVQAALDAAYDGFPDRVIADMRKHAATYQRYHDMVNSDDPKKAAGERAGALSEVEYAERTIAEMQNLKRRRQGLPELDIDVSLPESDASGNDDEGDFGPAPKRGRGRSKTAA
jgi:hypothetical protein